MRWKSLLILLTSGMIPTTTEERDSGSSKTCDGVGTHVLGFKNCLDFVAPKKAPYKLHGIVVVPLANQATVHIHHRESGALLANVADHGALQVL